METDGRSAALVAAGYECDGEEGSYFEDPEGLLLAPRPPQDVDESGWKWIKVDESERKWMKVDERGLKWMEVEESG